MMNMVFTKLAICTLQLQLENKMSISKNVTRTELRSIISSIYSEARHFYLTQAEIQEKLNEKLLRPLNVCYKNGRRKHPSTLAAYVTGYIDAEREHFMQTELEFCYEVEGVVYTTRHAKDSKRLTIDGIPAPTLQYAPHGFYYKNKDVRYF